MSKQEGRGYALHGFNWDCYNCCCSVCTGRYCPDKHKTFGWYRNRCADCAKSNGAMRICLDCDFFQNKHTSRRYFRIKRKYHREDAIISRLQKIMDKLDISDDSPSRHSYLRPESAKLLNDLVGKYDNLCLVDKDKK